MASAGGFDPTHLLVLLKAKSPRLVASVFADTFRLRHEGLLAEKRAAWQAELEITEAEADQVRHWKRQPVLRQ